jgi:hypothetical protein
MQPVDVSSSNSDVMASFIFITKTLTGLQDYQD